MKTYVEPDRYKPRTLRIEIGGLNEAQAVAIEDMLATWLQLGSLGSSRWTAFFADGDGDFNPTITVNGEKPKLTPWVTREQRWNVPRDTKSRMYWIDYDAIAWGLRARDEAKKPTPPVDPVAGHPIY